MEAKFTPGPWSQGRNGHNAAYIYAGDEAVASVYGIPLHTRVSDVQTEKFANGMANARLIAAAPDMFEALRAIHEQLVKQDINFGPLIADAEAALSKALPSNTEGE